MLDHQKIRLNRFLAIALCGAAIVAGNPNPALSQGPAPFTPIATPTRTPIIVRGGGDLPPIKPCGKICGFEAVTEYDTWSDPAGTRFLEVRALCPSGKIPLGGGVILSGAVNNVRVVTNGPWSPSGLPPAEGWVGLAIVDGDYSEHQPFTLDVWANCARVE